MTVQRNTRQREAVKAAILTTSEFRTAQQIFRDMVEAGESIGLATVYRNLQVLEEAGLVEAIRSEDGEFLYRQCDEDHHHHHLVCRKCNKSVVLPVAGLEEMIDEKAAEHGFTAIEHSFDVFGLCSNCA